MRTERDSARPLLFVLLVVVLCGGAGMALALVLRDRATRGDGRGGGSADVLHFHSRPDLRPDRVRVLVHRPGTAPDDLFLAVKRGPGQDGPMILDDDGQVVWFHRAPPGTTATSFSVQRYRGRPVLVWWQGHTLFGHGQGEYVVMDRRYRVIARIRAGDPLLGDHHEIQLTRRGTALMTVYHERPADLSKVGGVRDGRIFDSIVREVDIASGHVVFTWRAIDHVALSEGKTPPPPPRVPHDFFHVNSIDVDHDGDLIVSARNTHAIYKIDRRSGRVIWRLGGQRSDFRLGRGARFAFQHDARRQPDGTLTLFDNEATPRVGPQSRGLVLRLDTRRRRAWLVRAYTHPGRLQAIAEGNMQSLPNGNMLVGWGPARHVSEFTHGGRLILDLRVPDGADTYRAYRFPWHGRPRTRPSLTASAAAGGGSGHVTAWASWNGATAVRRWQLLAGPARDRLTPVATTPRTGFETTLHAPAGSRWLAVRALSADDDVLSESGAVAVPAHG